MPNRSWRIIRISEAFRAYTDLSEPRRLADSLLCSYTEVVVFLKADNAIQQIIFEGIPYTDVSVPIVGSESNSRSINLICLPVSDPRLETSRDLKTHYPHITKIIGQNTESQLVSTESADLPIVGTQAFIVFSEDNIQLDLEGVP